MVKIIIISLVLLIYFCVYSLCCAAKYEDNELEKLQKTEGKIKKDNNSNV